MTPNSPKTPGSTFRIPLDLKAAASAKASEEGKTLTAVINEALVRYTKAKNKRNS